MTYGARSAHALQRTKGTKAPPHRVGAGKRQARGKAWTASAQETEGQRRERGIQVGEAACN